MWFQLTLFPPPLSSLLFLSKQGKVFHEASFRLAFSSLILAAAPVRALAGGARAGNPSAPGSAGRGAAPAAAHGRSHPARTPRRRAQLAQGPSAAPSRPGGRQRLSGEVPAAGIEMTLLFLLWLGECLGASGRPEGPGKHTPASGLGRWLSTAAPAVPGVSQSPLPLPYPYGEAHLAAEGRSVGHGKRLTHLGPGAGLGLGVVPDPVGVNRLMWKVLLGDGV